MEIRLGRIEDLDTISNKIKQEIESVKNSIEDTTKGKWKLYFRGEAKKYEEVNASIFRDDFLLEHEGEYLKNLIANENLEEDLNSLGKIQHYGGSTRLLDFTKNFNVALYFACREYDNEDGYIYCYNTDSIDDENSAICKILADFSFLPSKNLQEELKSIANKHNKSLTTICNIVSKDYFLDFDLLKENNLRMTRQDGLFLWMGDTKLNINNCKKSKATSLSERDGRGKAYPGVILKVIVSNFLKKEIRKYLENPITYTNGYLFPDEPAGTAYNFHSAERKYFERLVRS